MKKNKKISIALSSSFLIGGGILASVAVSCAQDPGYSSPNVAVFNNLLSNGVNGGTNNTFVAMIGSELCAVCRDYLDYDDSVREQRGRVQNFYSDPTAPGFVNDFIVPFLGHGQGAFNNFARGDAANSGIATYALIDRFRTTDQGAPEPLLTRSNITTETRNEQSAVYYAYWLRNDSTLLDTLILPDGLSTNQRPLTNLSNESYYMYNSTNNIFNNAAVPSGESGFGFPITLWVTGGNIAAWTIGALTNAALSRGLRQFITDEFLRSSSSNSLVNGINFLTKIDPVSGTILIEKF